jgi:hypothetical protein
MSFHIYITIICCKKRDVRSISTDALTNWKAWVKGMRVGRKKAFTRPSPRQHVHCLNFGFRRKRIMSRVCFHERQILVFCIKFFFKKNPFSNVLQVREEAKTHDLLQRRQHLLSLPCLFQILSEHVHNRPQPMINPPLAPLQYQSTLHRPDISQPNLTTGSECSFHRTSTSSLSQSLIDRPIRLMIFQPA